MLYEGDRSTWAIGFDHNFSKRTTAYILYTQVTDDQNDLPNISAIVADRAAAERDAQRLERLLARSDAQLLML